VTVTSPKTVARPRLWPTSTPPGNPRGVDHLADAGFPLSAQIQVILVEQPQQLPALSAEAILQLGVAECARPVAVEEADQLLEAGPAAGKAILIDTVRYRSSSWAASPFFNDYAVGKHVADRAAGRVRSER